MDPQLQSEPVQQPVAFPPQTPTSSGLPKILLIGLALIVAVGIGSGAYILGISKGKSAMQSEQKQQTAQVSTPTPLPSNALTKEGDPTASWKTYSTSKFSFQYPSNLVIKETDKDYFVFVESDKTPASNSNMSLDARFSSVYANYEQAVKSTKEGLINVKEESAGKWLKISGLIKPPFREGTSITVALYKYGQGAIEFEISGNAPVSESIFNQILSTFRFY